MESLYSMYVQKILGNLTVICRMSLRFFLHYFWTFISAE